MRSVIVWLIGLFFFCSGVLWWFLSSDYSEIKERQVLHLAVAEDNYLLPIYPHIKDVARPSENFSFPIPLGSVGPIQSLYSGENQYPFYCMTIDSKLGQPRVDNTEKLGVSVYDSQGNLIGYSKDCSLPSQLHFFYLSKAGTIEKVTQRKILQGEVDDIDLLFRVEVGTINRFIYSLIMPIAVNEVADRWAHSQWNKKLIYQFEGGSGIGYRQGKARLVRKIKKRLAQLRLGYAVISSTGNRTSYTYNMLLAEDTMRRVKKHFVSLYSQPKYTVGIGGSGGGLAQYLIAQNAPGLLDAIIPQYSYPDMITTATYALDCDLLNNYYTFRAGINQRWQNSIQRQLLEGMNSSDSLEQRTAFLQPINQLLAGVMPAFPKGNSECINGWFGLSSFIHNPKQGFLRPMFSDHVVEQTHWSYWQDNVWLFGKDGQGFAHTTWDNQGVQYGLNALNIGAISIDEFIHLNQNIGGWKKQSEMAEEKILLPLGRKKPIWLSLWGTHNIYQKSASQLSAPRQPASLEAINAAYRGGQVYLGFSELPIIDLRHYLENDLDMHHVSASFLTRTRIKNRLGHSEHHLIWVAHKNYNPEIKAFDLIDQWLTNLEANPQLTVADAKPKEAVDTCFNEEGKLIASGQTVWDGIWNSRAEGICSSYFPYFSNSRVEAGGGWANSIFKCQLIPVEKAINSGLYKVPSIELYQSQLENTFPDGVCDYSKPDLGLPLDLH